LNNTMAECEDKWVELIPALRCFIFFNRGQVEHLTEILKL